MYIQNAQIFQLHNFSENKLKMRTLYINVQLSKNLPLRGRFHLKAFTIKSCPSKKFVSMGKVFVLKILP